MNIIKIILRILDAQHETKFRSQEDKQITRALVDGQWDWVPEADWLKPKHTEASNEGEQS
jgi:hypothetical protein